MKCRECERDLPESDFYWKPGHSLASPDCKLCFNDKQRVRRNKLDCLDRKEPKVEPRVSKRGFRVRPPTKDLGFDWIDYVCPMEQALRIVRAR